MNNPINWLIEINTFDDGNPEKICSIAKALGHVVYWIKYVPIDQSIQFLLADKEDNQVPEKFRNSVRPLVRRTRIDEPTLKYPVLVYGSLNLAKYVLKNRPWTPALWCNFHTLRCSYYYSFVSDFIIQKKYFFLPLGELLKHKDFIYQTLAVNDHVFIRPDDNAKSFNGELVAIEKLSDFYNTAQLYDPQHDLMCLIASPVKIYAEWRFIVVDSKVVTGSQYRMNGFFDIAAGYNPEAKEYAEQIIAVVGNQWDHPAYSMDIALTDDGYKLIEIGGANTCGLYECDIEAYVKAMSKLASYYGSCGQGESLVDD